MHGDDGAEVDELGAVHADEVPRFETALEFGERIVQHVLDALEPEESDLVASTQARDFSCIEHVQNVSGPCGDARRSSLVDEDFSNGFRHVGSRVVTSRTNLVEGLDEPCPRDGLEQIVDGVDLERLERMLADSDVGANR